MATTNDLKNGMTLDIEGQLWNVVDFQHVKPGKGPAFVRTKLKNVLSGKVVEKTFNAGVKVDVAILEKRDMQFLYKDPSGFVFMDSTTSTGMRRVIEVIARSFVNRSLIVLEIIVITLTNSCFSC
mgnify:CR=1 FL=1